MNIIGLFRNLTRAIIFFVNRWYYFGMGNIDEFEKDKIKDYTHWAVYIAKNQGYLGRCVIWCKREDVKDLADATPDEQKELFVVLKDLREATKEAFGANWFNYAFLGNETRHLHCHFIPRYASEREFAGMKFTDERWGHNYRTDEGFVTSEDIFEKIKDALEKELSD